MGAHYSHVSDDERTEIVRLLHAGYSYKRIADAIGRNRTTVVQCVRKMGLRSTATSGRTSRLSPEMIAVAVECRRADPPVTWKVLADVLECSESHLCSVVLEFMRE